MEVIVKKYLLGLLSGIALVTIGGIILMPQMGKYFFVEDVSLLSFDATVSKVRENCSANKEWHLLQEKDYNKAYHKRGAGDLDFRLVEFKLGNPDHSYRINCENPAVCTFMPASIAIVGYKNGKVIIYRKNTSLMGRMYTGVVRDIMRDDVMPELDEILNGVIKK